MIDENEFFRNITLKLCGHLEIEEGLHACIQYLSQYLPADAIYLERYEEDVGAMRFIARADSQKGEPLNILVPMSEEARAKAAVDMKEIATNPRPVFRINRPDEDPIARHLLKALEKPQSSILGIPLVVEGQFAGAVILAALGNDRFDDPF